MVEKSTSDTLISELKRSRIKCSPLLSRVFCPKHASHLPYAIRSFLEFSLDDGTTSRLILLLSQLSLAACELIVSTVSSAMTGRSRSQRTDREGERFEG